SKVFIPSATALTTL
ncbi:unnamed protein product, partial [Allacma fusca]